MRFPIIPLHAVNRIIADRFGRWQRLFSSELATPILTVGLRVSDGTIIMTTCEETTDDQVIQMLESALGLYRAGKVESR